MFNTTLTTFNSSITPVSTSNVAGCLALSQLLQQPLQTTKLAKHYQTKEYLQFLQERHIDKECLAKEAKNIAKSLELNGFIKKKYSAGKLVKIITTFPTVLPQSTKPSLWQQGLNMLTRLFSLDKRNFKNEVSLLEAIDEIYIKYRLEQLFFATEPPKSSSDLVFSANNIGYNWCSEVQITNQNLYVDWIKHNSPPDRTTINFYNLTNSYFALLNNLGKKESNIANFTISDIDNNRVFFTHNCSLNSDKPSFVMQAYSQTWNISSALTEANIHLLWTPGALILLILGSTWALCTCLACFTECCCPKTPENAQDTNNDESSMEEGRRLLTRNHTQYGSTNVEEPRLITTASFPQASQEQRNTRFPSPSSSFSFFKPAEFKLNPPAEYICPINQDLMAIPCTTLPALQTYEHSAITNWLTAHSTDPLTRLPVTKLGLNSHLMQEIGTWAERNKETWKRTDPEGYSAYLQRKEVLPNINLPALK